MIAEPVERGRVVFEHMIGDSGGIHRVSETHEMGWFTDDEYILAQRSGGSVRGVRGASSHGISLAEGSLGMGLGLEAVAAVCNWVADEVECDYIRYPVDRANGSSRNIPESTRSFKRCSQANLSVSVQQGRLFFTRLVFFAWSL